MPLDAESSAILRRRTAALARPVTPRDPPRGSTSVVARLGRDLYAIDSTYIQRVLEVISLVALPFVPLDQGGVIAWGGRPIIAIHLRYLLGLPLKGLPEHGRSLLCYANGSELALIVDAVDRTVQIDEDALVEPSGEVTTALRNYMRGITPDGVTALDGEKLLSLDAAILDARGNR